ncbi:MAG TPA: hypothetical protein VF375_04805, partial [Candidatus Limnocylindrales bacterium]
DCPLVDPAVVAKAVRLFAEKSPPIVYVGFDKSYPEGLDVEVVAFGALKTAWRKAKLQSEREHVTPFIWKQPERFPQDRIRNGDEPAHEHWSVDRLEDYEFVKVVYAALDRAGAPGTPFSMDEILGLLSAHPELRQLNAGINAHEGYLKSIRNDCATEVSA